MFLEFEFWSLELCSLGFWIWVHLGAVGTSPKIFFERIFVYICLIFLDLGNLGR